LSRTVVLGFPGDVGSALVERVRGVASDLNVLTVNYQDTPESRSARGRGDMEAALRLTQPATDEQAAIFTQADILLTFELPVDIGRKAQHLQWVQGIGAGLDHWRGAALGPEVMTTSAAGVAAAPIAEFVMARVLQVIKRLPELDASQLHHVWQPAYGRRLAGLTMGIVGFGAIGSRVAHLANAFGMRVLAVRRTPQPDEVATVYGPDGLGEVLEGSDVLVVAAPASEETFQLIDAAALERMRPGAIFCNVARGSLVDENALLAALQTGHLGAAILDVTAQEPLPASSPLWDAPNLLLSPHSSASIDGYVDAIYDLFCENLQRHLAGQPLRNRVQISAAHAL
jgi:phosphoglycerate dehydrogenase-like enzyme